MDLDTILQKDYNKSMKHLILINLWRILHEIHLFFNSNAILDKHWSWKFCPWPSFKWCAKNYGSVNSAKKALLWWHK